MMNEQPQENNDALDEALASMDSENEPEQVSSIPSADMFKRAAGGIKQGFKKVKEALGNLVDDGAEPEKIEIPVEGLGSGIWTTAQHGLDSLTAVGRYAIMGVKYGVQDGINLTDKAVNLAKDKMNKSDPTAEPKGTSEECDEKAA